MFSCLLLTGIVFALTCSVFLTVSVFLTALSLCGTAVFLRSQVVNKGGIQFQERSLIGWFGKFGWFSYPFSIFFLLFSFYFPYVTTDCWATRSCLSCSPVSIFFLHCFPLTSVKMFRMAWFRQPTHGMWEWVRVPALTGRGCLASYSKHNVLMAYWE